MVVEKEEDPQSALLFPSYKKMNKQDKMIVFTINKKNKSKVQDDYIATSKN